MFKKVIFLFALIRSLSLFSQVPLSEQARVSILTCGTAPVTYAMYGHTAIRIQDSNNGIDQVYNYGAFDFSTPNFALRFIKGDLQYFITSDAFADFEYSYQLDNRSIYEQELKLQPAQKQQLFDELNRSLYSEERFYTYKFIDRNCTTMVVDKINKILGSEVIQQPKNNGSYRDILFPYMTDFYQKLGIQLIFGTKVDQKATRLFLPFELKKALEQNPTISRPTVTLFAATPQEISSNWINSFYSLFALMVLLIVSQKKWIQITYFTLAGLLGVFFSVVGLYSLHEEVLWNYNILLFNPLLLLFVYYYAKKQLEKTILFGQILIALTGIYCVYMLNKIHLSVVFPFIALHFFWLIRITISSKRKLRLT